MKWLTALRALLGLGHKVVEKEKADAEADLRFADELVSPGGVEASRAAREAELRKLEEEGL